MSATPIALSGYTPRSAISENGGTAASVPVPRQKPDVTALLATSLLGREVGQRIPTVQELQHLAHVGSGTVIKALRDLEAKGAVALSSHGHRGTLITQRDVGRLWNEAGLGSFVVSMPPSGPIEQHGILETLRSSLNRQGISLVVNALAGSRRRVEELYHERVHAAVLSAGAYDQGRTAHPGLLTIDLGEGTFYSPGSLVVVSRRHLREELPLRVGIDRASHDHQLLTTAVFDACSPEYVDTHFVTAPAAVLRGEIDAAVWHSMPTVIPPALAGLDVRPLNPEVLALAPEATTAVLVTRALDAPANAALRELDPAEVRRTQRQLLRRASDEESGTFTVWPR